MNKFLFICTTLLVLLWNCCPIFAGKEQKNSRVKRDDIIKQMTKKRSAETNQPGGSDKRKRIHELREKRLRQRGLRSDRNPRQTRRRSRDEMSDVNTGKAIKSRRQQLEQFKTQLLHENTKHSQRLARLQRIRQLALEENSDKTVERVDKLLAKEQKRYDRKQQKINQRIRKTLRSDRQNPIKGKRPDVKKSPGPETDEDK